MKKIDLSQTITVLANIGVIAGIVFLGIELNQSNQLARAQTRSDISTAIGSLAQMMATDPDLYGIYIRGAQDLDELTTEERARLNSVWILQMRIWENVHYQYRSGLFDEADYAVEREAWKDFTDGRYFRSYFCGIRKYFSQGFIRELMALHAVAKADISAGRPEQARDVLHEALDAAMEIPWDELRGFVFTSIVDSMATELPRDLAGESFDRAPPQARLPI